MTIAIGDKISVNVNRLKGTDCNRIKKEGIEEVTVCGVYPTYILVDNGRYKYSASYIDLVNSMSITI